MKAVNLIPSDQRPAVKGSTAGDVGSASTPTPFGAYVILAALVFAIAGTALYVLASNAISDNNAELSRVQQEAKTVQAQASSLQAFADFKTLSASRKDTVKGLAASRFPWPSTLADVSRALPEDVYLSSLDGTTSTGTGGSSLRGAIQAPSIEIEGCTKDQTSVARLMSRLRDVRGVTRVTLSKSESIDAADTASAPAPVTAAAGSENPSITTEPCPKGAPPSFDVIVFFERAAVNPNAATNAAGPTTPATAGPTGAKGATGTTPASTTTKSASAANGAAAATPSPSTP